MGDQLRVGEVLRSGRNTDPDEQVIEGYRNIHHVTASRDLAQIQLSKGINPMAQVKAAGGLRRPAILIRSSPWKAGSVETPWHDVFDLDNGHVRYFGDHRVDHEVAVGKTSGNTLLLNAVAEHQASSPEKRALAVPLLLFASVTRNKTPKGYVQFCGVGVIEHAEVIEQEAKGSPFLNYRYDIAVLDLSSEDDQVDWAWIEARGNPDLTATDVLEYAPRSWRRWVEHGHAVLPEERRRTPPSDGDAAAHPRIGSRSHSPEDDNESPGLLPAPRIPSGRTTLPPQSGLEGLTESELMSRLRNLRVHSKNGRASRHKPLALLWGISRVASGKPRLASWRQFQAETGGLLAEFGHPDSQVTPEYPFWHLRTSRLWDVHGIPPDEIVKPHAATFDRVNPEGGMTEQAGQLLADPFVRSQAVAILRESYLGDVDQRALMDRLGLAGYETASGRMEEVEDEVHDEEGNSGPASRRRTNVARIVRDARLVAKVKWLHGDECQVCGLQLPIRFTNYSEAAHIRGLGRPHNGPDELENLLVLCPNHHVQFDGLAIYIRRDGTVLSTRDESWVGELRRHPDHVISEAHLRYHRALCGRDDRS
ncbi:HNH endonuclease [Streptomyces niveus]|uniref:HNH endonuclease n=1 Tax=Streptomyces niveus TaxID=193462 RepID=UPI0034473A15